MTKNIEYELTPSLYQFLLVRGQNLICIACGQSFKIGDRIVCRHGKRSTRTKRYHEKCWEATFNRFTQPHYSAPFMRKLEIKGNPK